MCCYNAGIRVTIPLVFWLEQPLHSIIDRKLKVQQKRKRGTSEDLLYLNAIPVRPKHYRRSMRTRSMVANTESKRRTLDSFPGVGCWLVFLLDPSDKGKVTELGFPWERAKDENLEDVLWRNVETIPSLLSLKGGGAVVERGGGDCLSQTIKIFFRALAAGSYSGEYMGSSMYIDTLLTNDPLNYWVTRMDHLPELSQ